MNHDYAWFTAEEARSLVPQDAQVGQSYPIPGVLVQRLARYHLVDTVRGESPRWQAEDVKKAEMTLMVEDITEGRVSLRLEGTVLNTAPPSLHENPFSKRVVDQERGVDLQLAGYLVYNRSEAAFERSDLIATRSHATPGDSGGLLWGVPCAIQHHLTVSYLRCHLPKMLRGIRVNRHR